MSKIQSKRAKRELLIGAIAFIGPSGSGKTLAAILTAYGMMAEKYPDLNDYDLWGKIAVIDTEHKRSLVYEGMTHQGVKIGEYIFIELTAPYTVARYDEAMSLAKSDGAEVVVIDSISHAWEGEGGLLELNDSFGNNSMSNWKFTNPYYRDLIKLITGERHKIHVINTIRTKQGYDIEKDELGKLQVKKVGLKPTQRDNLEYEFQLTFNLDMDNLASASKDNSSLYKNKPSFVVTPEVGATIYKWLEAGEDVEGKIEEERKTYINLIRGLETEFGEKISKAIKLIETHHNVNTTIELMNVIFLERAYVSIKKDADRLRTEQDKETAINQLEKTNKVKDQEAS